MWYEPDQAQRFSIISLYIFTVVPLKLKMDKILVHAKHNGLRMKEGFKYFFNGEFMLHFKSVQFKLW